MAGIQIPNLPAAIALGGNELIEVVQSGVSMRASISQLPTGQVSSLTYELREITRFGVVIDGVVIDAYITTNAGSSTVSSSSITFSEDDVGKTIGIPGAGTAGAYLTSTIVSFTNATTVVLAATASTSLANQLKEIAYGTDNTSSINAAMALGIGAFKWPPGICIVTGELAIKNHSGIVGSGAHWKRRTTQDYGQNAETVFKYIGAGGANSCVVRAAIPAVGSFATTLTEDLLDYQLSGFHIDCTGLAEIGLYSYRAGNCASQNAITSERAKQYNIVHLGTFAASFGVFGAYEGENFGVACGWDIFSWASAEATNFAFKARYLTANNGTSHTYVKGSGTDQENSGGKFQNGRGSEISVTAESNYGRAGTFAQLVIGGGSGGETIYNCEYFEGNGDGAYIRYRDSNDGMTFRDGFIHPGNGSTLLSQDFFISGQNDAGVATTNSGPADFSKWLTFEGLQGELSGVGFGITSNTNKFRVQRCPRSIVYASSTPLFNEYTPISSWVGAHIYFTAAASPTTWNSYNCTIARQSAGLYRVTFTRPFKTGIVPTVNASIAISAALDTSVRLTSIATATIDITTYDNAGSAADTGDRISVMCSGELS